MLFHYFHINKRKIQRFSMWQNFDKLFLNKQKKRKNLLEIKY